MSEKSQNYLIEICNNIASTIETRIEKYVSLSETIALNNEIIQLLEMSDKENPMQSHDIVNNYLTYSSAIERNESAILNIGIVDIDQDAFIQHDGAMSGSSWSFPTRPFYTAVTSQKQL